MYLKRPYLPQPCNILLNRQVFRSTDWFNFAKTKIHIPSFSATGSDLRLKKNEKSIEITFQYIEDISLVFLRRKFFQSLRKKFRQKYGLFMQNKCLAIHAGKNYRGSSIPEFVKIECCLLLITVFTTN